MKPLEVSKAINMIGSTGGTSQPTRLHVPHRAEQDGPGTGALLPVKMLGVAVRSFCRQEALEYISYNATFVRYRFMLL